MIHQLGECGSSEHYHSFKVSNTWSLVVWLELYSQMAMKEVRVSPNYSALEHFLHFFSWKRFLPFDAKKPLLGVFSPPFFFKEPPLFLFYKMAYPPFLLQIVWERMPLRKHPFTLNYFSYLVVADAKCAFQICLYRLLTPSSEIRSLLEGCLAQNTVLAFPL